MASSQANINLGQINFINCLRINYCFKKWNLESVNTYSTYPTKVNTLLKQGKLDIAPISSIEYINNKDKCTLLDSICISSYGKVESVILFSNFNIKELEGKKIALPYTSATSIELLKILLLHHKIDLNSITFITHKYENPLKDSLKEYDAILYIGNKALIENNTVNTCNKYDLGDEWYSITNLPMVFGTWAINNNWLKNNADNLNYLNNLFTKAIDDSFNIYLNEIVDEASKITNLKKNIVEDYMYNKIQLQFNEKHKKSLRLFEEFYGSINHE